MMLFFDADPPFVRYAIWDDQNSRLVEEGRVPFTTEELDSIAQKAGGSEKIDALGYLLRHGGDDFVSSEVLMRRATLDTLEKSVHLSPEANDLTFKLASHWFKRYEKAPHVLFCDTAFFTQLSEEASTYAVPLEMKSLGVKRYGGHGLLHEWASERASTHVGAGRVVSICLNDVSSVAAIRAGKPLSCSIGFSPVEGLPSMHSCGDIDTTVVFELLGGGFSLDDVGQMLATRSGLKALTGRKSSLSDILNAEPGTAEYFARDIFMYALLKYIGASIGTLGGLDAIMLLARADLAASSFIDELVGKLEFLGLSRQACPPRFVGESELSSPGSKVRAFLLEADIWELMARKAKKLLSEWPKSVITSAKRGGEVR
jgi:acetate kinase